MKRINKDKLRRFILALGNACLQFESQLKQVKNDTSKQDEQQKQEVQTKPLSFDEKLRIIKKTLNSLKDDKAFTIYVNHRLEYILNILSNDNKKDILLDQLFLEVKEHFVRRENEKKIANLQKKIILKNQLLALKNFDKDLRALLKENLSRSQIRKVNSLLHKVKRIIDLINEKIKVLDAEIKRPFGRPVKHRSKKSKFKVKKTTKKKVNTKKKRKNSKRVKEVKKAVSKKQKKKHNTRKVKKKNKGNKRKSSRKKRK